MLSNGTNGQLQKPDVVYLQNTNLLHVVAPDNINNQNLRSTFFYNQVGSRMRVSTSKKFDFKVDDKYEFTVGGKYSRS